MSQVVRFYLEIKSFGAYRLAVSACRAIGLDKGGSSIADADPGRLELSSLRHGSAELGPLYCLFLEPTLLFCDRQPVLDGPFDLPWLLCTRTIVCRVLMAHAKDSDGFQDP